jgi:hypothetical protein
VNIRRRLGGEFLPWARGFPFFLGEPRTAVERLRAAGSKQVWTQGPLWRRLALGSAMAMSWPIVTLIDAVKLSARRASEGRSAFLSSFGGLYRAALTRNIPPYQAALYESALDRTAGELSDVLLPLDLRALQRLSVGQGAVLQAVQNKARFEELCRAHGIACVRTLAVFDHGTSTGEDILRTWTEPVFVKALTGNRGVGVELWRPAGRGFTSSSGMELTVDELIASFRPQNCIVQPVLEDHAALKAFGTSALSNVRIVTAKGLTIRSTPVAAAISLAVEEESLTGHEGIHCGIDIETGAIVRTLDPEGDDRRLSRSLIGFALPDWSECISLVRKAHDDAFPAFTTLGWDVALTPRGPILLETNVNWGMLGHQRLTGPLGRTALADVIDELLAPGPAHRYSEDHPSTRVAQSPSPAPRANRDSSAARDRKPRRPATKAS